MVTFRAYQIDAVNAAARALARNNATLVVAATGAGKSLILAHLAQRICNKDPSYRVLALCYVQEILEGNNEACQALGLDTGIYCAALGKRDTDARVIHASRDSLGRSPEACGRFDAIIVDEAHLLSDKENSRYERILNTLQPRFLIGLTATPYRLDGGFIYGEGRRFPSVCYEIDHEMLERQGFLVPFVFPAQQETLVDASKLKIVNGEFDKRGVSDLVLHTDIVKASLTTWACHAHARRCSLFFCHSLEHARLCLSTFRAMFPGLPAGYLDGTTNKAERAALIADTRAGKFRAVFQCQTMTTGTNIPIIDCIVWLRPTASPVLFVQGSGRGSRLFPGKENCLVIDVVGNMTRFGSIYKPNVTDRKIKKKTEFSEDELRALGIDPDLMRGQPVSKECPNCKALIAGSSRTCPECAHLFLSQTELYCEGATGVVVAVREYTHRFTQTRGGEAALKITYYTERGEHTEWILFQRPWLRGTFELRKRQLRSPQKITHLKIEPRPGHPKYPKLTPLVLDQSQSPKP